MTLVLAPRSLMFRYKSSALMRGSLLHHSHPIEACFKTCCWSFATLSRLLEVSCVQVPARGTKYHRYAGLFLCSDSSLKAELGIALNQFSHHPALRELSALAWQCFLLPMFVKQTCIFFQKPTSSWYVPKVTKTCHRSSSSLTLFRTCLKLL